MESYELHYTIIQLLPHRAKEILSNIDFNDFNKLSESLSQLDLTFGDNQNNFRKIMQQQLESNERKNTENKSSNAKGETCNMYREEARILVGVKGVRLLLWPVLTWKGVSMGGNTPAMLLTVLMNRDSPFSCRI